jgi:hypothetical protein
MKKRVIQILFAVGCIVILLLCLSQCDGCAPKKGAGVPTKPIAVKAIQDSLFDAIDIPYETIEVDADKAQIITTASGETLTIPAGAFLNAKGEKVTGKVSLKFRKFTNPVEYVVARIPMTYQGKIMESGGMFELNALQQNDTLLVNPEQKIKMKYASWTSSQDYRIFNLNKSTNAWELTGKDEVVSQKNKNDQSDKTFIKSKPRLASSNAFSIQDETQRYPEVKEYENVLFDPVDNDCGLTEGNFTDFDLKSNKDGSFTVTGILKIGNKVVSQQSCRCYLAFQEGIAYSKAMQTYQQKYKRYLDRHLQNVRSKEEKKIIYDTRDESIGEINRIMEIDNFGYVNCDILFNIPSDYFVPDFQDFNGKPIEFYTLFLVNKKRKTYLSCNDLNKITYFREQGNVLWGVSKQGEYLYLKSEEFNQIQPGEKRQKIRLHTKKEVKNLEELKSLIYQ